MSYKVLLVEDSEDERFFFKDAVCNLSVKWSLRTASSVEDCIVALKTESPGNDGLIWRSPELIVVDLNLGPNSSGLEILAYLDELPDMKTINRVVLSGTNDPSLIALAYRAGAKSVLEKPLDTSAWGGIILFLDHQWKSGASQPPS